MAELARKWENYTTLGAFACKLSLSRLFQFPGIKHPQAQRTLLLRGILIGRQSDRKIALQIVVHPVKRSPARFPGCE